MIDRELLKQAQYARDQQKRTVETAYCRKIQGFLAFLGVTVRVDDMLISYKDGLQIVLVQVGDFMTGYPLQISSREYGWRVTIGDSSENFSELDKNTDSAYMVTQCARFADMLDAYDATRTEALKQFEAEMPKDHPLHNAIRVLELALDTADASDYVLQCVERVKQEVVELGLTPTLPAVARAKQLVVNKNQDNFDTLADVFDMLKSFAQELQIASKLKSVHETANGLMDYINEMSNNFVTVPYAAINAQLAPTTPRHPDFDKWYQALSEGHEVDFGQFCVYLDVESYTKIGTHSSLISSSQRFGTAKVMLQNLQNAIDLAEQWNKDHEGK